MNKSAGVNIERDPISGAERTVGPAAEQDPTAQIKRDQKQQGTPSKKQGLVQDQAQQAQDDQERMRHTQPDLTK